jgi:hypothetical protein
VVVVEGIAVVLATGVVESLVVAAGVVESLVVATGVVAGLVVAATDVVVGLVVFSGGGPKISSLHGFLVFFRSFTQFVPTLVKFTAQSHRHGVGPLTQHPLYMT